MKHVVPLCLGGIVASSIAYLAVSERPQSHEPRKSSTSIVGNPSKFRALYSAWRDRHERSSDRDTLELGLNWSRAMSTERTPAHGTAYFDLRAKTLAVDVENMPAGASYDAWLVDNAPNSSVAPEDNDTMAFLGTLTENGGTAKLAVDLDQGSLRDFDVDLVVITAKGQLPQKSALLLGMPNVFERLASRERAQSGAKATGFVLGAVSVASAPASAANMFFFDDLVSDGEKFFFQGTFGGNGRTCGTCHPAENNFTIDVPFIQTLPPDDPLFVAEFNPDLNFDTNGGLRFENPVLMHQFGLIAENLDGFDDLAHRFVMRSVPHTLGMVMTITSPDGPGVVPVQRTGWSGDGAPGHGSLREFAIGAVRQHFTRTMNRIPGVDFVFPTDDELDALEAFQLSLGRDQDLDLNTLSLIDPGAAAGQIAFQNNRCTRCHENAGANEGGVNVNRSTGVEAFARNHPDGTGEERPPDGGLGTNGAGGFDTIEATPEPDDRYVLSFGNKTFNVPSLVEFADTVPGFHNNITNMGSLDDSVEGAVKFYSSSEFANSPDGFTITFSGSDIEDIGKFLRVINALENRRSADAYGQRAADLISAGGFDPAAVEHVLTLAQAECTDAIEVLTGASIHLNDAVPNFKRAFKRFEMAKSGTDASRLANIDAARNINLKAARLAMQN